MRYLYLLIVIILANDFSSLALASSYRLCDVSMGLSSSFCKTSYSGEAVIKREDGVVAICEISIGNITFCKGPFSGQAVLEKKGIVQICNISLGKITFCFGQYQGQAILKKKR